eukprot:361044-Chlamydomonas_euryale.AAC.7
MFQVLALLRDELAVAPSRRPPLTDLSIGYRAPGEEAVLRKVGWEAYIQGLKFGLGVEGSGLELHPQGLRFEVKVGGFVERLPGLLASHSKLAAGGLVEGLTLMPHGVTFKIDSWKTC